MARSRRRAALAVACALLLASCSSGGDGPSAASDASPAVVRGDELPVTVEAESAGTVTATVGTDGGALAATAGDGTGYLLQIPPDALPGTVAITMTPLASMAGLPDGATLAFGVSLEPEGLLFAKPSWLFVTAAVAPDEVASGLAVGGDRATLRGVGFDGDHFVVPVAHFSGAGGIGCVGPCRPGSIDWPGLRGAGAGTQPPPGAPGGGPVQPPGPGVPTFEPPGTPPAPGGDAGGAGGDRGSLTDGLGGGAASGDGAPAGDSLRGEVGDALADLGDAQLRGDEDAERDAEAKLDTVKKKVKDRVWNLAEQCVDERDITTLKDLIYWETVGSLLGYEKDDAEGSTLFSLIEACNRFEMDAQGELVFSIGGGVFRIGDSVGMKVPLLMQAPAWEGAVSGPVKPLGYDRGVELLELFGAGMGTLMGIDVPNDVSANDYISCTTAPATANLRALATGILDGTINVVLEPSTVTAAEDTCPHPIGSFPIDPFVTDLAGYIESGFPGATEAGIVLGGWEPGRGRPSIATKSIVHRIAEEGGELVVTWQLEIVHAPGPLPPRPVG